MNGVRRLRRDVEALRRRLPDGPNAAALTARMDVAEACGSAIELALVDIYRETPRDVLRHPARLDDTLGDILWNVMFADAAPATQVVAVAEEVMAKVAEEVAAWDRIVARDVAEMNAMAKALGAPAIAV